LFVARTHTLGRVMLAGLPVPPDAVEELVGLVRAADADDLADRLERAVAEEVKLLALTLDERAVMLAALEDPPQQLAELRAVLLADHQWRRTEGLD
jgi:delta 1-pyrroline-5-carboxylate dehydrogenase